MCEGFLLTIHFRFKCLQYAIMHNIIPKVKQLALPDTKEYLRNF